MINENFDTVLQEIEKIRLKINNYYYFLISIKKLDPECDIRVLYISQLNNILISHNLNIKYIIRNISNIDWVKNELSILDNESAFLVFDNYITYNKLALINTLSSITERFFRLILKQLDNSIQITDEFYNIRSKIFDNLNFDKDKNLWIALSILTNIRNTTHNNGIHLTKSDLLKEIKLIYHNIPVSFSNDTLHTNATYEIINLIINDLFCLATNINAHEFISKFKTIKDKN